MSDSATIEMPLVADPSTHKEDEVAHIIKRDDLNRGYIGQEEVEALCGYKWVPHKNPEKLPICQPCFEIMKRLKQSHNN